MNEDKVMYEVEAYQSIFDKSDSAVAWLDSKRTLLEDAGFTVNQYSMHTPKKGQYNANIQASRGNAPAEEPMY